MSAILKRGTCYILLPLVAISLLQGCHTAKKMDVFIAEQYNNELPKPDKKKNPDITVNSSIPSDPVKISVTETKTSNLLPLIVYWHYDYRHTCTLNPAIAVANFRKTINQQANKLTQKLNGQQLELNVEQVPGGFAIVDKENFLLFIHWNRMYVEPDAKDLIVSYKVLQNGNQTKSGKITIRSKQQDQGIRFAQSWKSSTSEFLGRYNVDVADMSKNFVNKLIEEL